MHLWAPLKYLWDLLYYTFIIIMNFIIIIIRKFGKIENLCTSISAGNFVYFFGLPPYRTIVIYGRNRKKTITNRNSDYFKMITIVL
jgi:hypothetical protein